MYLLKRNNNSTGDMYAVGQDGVLKQSTDAPAGDGILCSLTIRIHVLFLCEVISSRDY